LDGFRDKLLTLDFDANYTAVEVKSADGGRVHFARYLQQLLEIVRSGVRADRGFVALAGFEIGKYTALAQFGYGPAALQSLPTSGSRLPEADLLHSERALHVLKGTSSLVKRAEVPAHEYIHLNLIGHGEIIGFVCLERTGTESFDSTDVDRLRTAGPLLTALVAEQNFSVRVHRLAQAFELHRHADDNELDLLFEEIAELTALAFAADAVALRIFDPLQGHLPMRATRGHIGTDLLVDRRPGEHISGKLLQDPDHDWAAFDSGPGGLPMGMAIDEPDREQLRQAGVSACLIMRLSSEASEDEEDKKIGTLSYHMRRPHQFSWRDLALFRSYCQRVADAIALERQTMRLKESKDDLELEHMMLLAQYQQATNTDIIGLIAHDLFHRSFHACTALDDYMKRVEKALRKQGVDGDPIRADGERALHAASEIQGTLAKLRTMQKSANKTEIEPPSQIKLKDVVDEIENVLGGPLGRNKITIRRSFGDDLSFWGPRSIFGHVIFNLVINSIDAARMRTTSRPMSIHVHAKKESRRIGEVVTIQFWDEGPGINRQVFRDPNSIFQIGQTTKENGTGTGLPVTRHLLNKHFEGSIQLDDPEKALFRIHIPVPTWSRTERAAHS
jgi:signal transduction histidine kinase